MKAVSFGVYFVFSVCLLMLTFNIAEYLSNTNRSKISTISSYIILALLLSIIGAYLVPWVVRFLLPKLSGSGWVSTGIISGIIFLLLCLVSTIFGPLGVDIAGTRIRGIFFAEFKFLNFIVYDAMPLAFLGGILDRFVKSYPRSGH